MGGGHGGIINGTRTLYENRFRKVNGGIRAYCTPLHCAPAMIMQKAQFDHRNARYDSW